MNHWYISLSHKYPRGKTRQVELKKHYTIIECYNEAEPREIDRFKLIYLGFGFFSDKYIKENYVQYSRRIEYGNRKNETE